MDQPREKEKPEILQQLIDLNVPYHRIEIKEHTRILGLFVGTDEESIDVTVDVIHSTPDLSSLCIFKAVLFDQSRFNFRGNLIINKGAKRTDTYLKAQVLMLSEQAHATAIPALEITEDEVKGGHGATVGQLDPEQLFYLKSKGLTEEQAKSELVKGFISDITGYLNTPTNTNEGITTEYLKIINEQLEKAQKAL